MDNTRNDLSIRHATSEDAQAVHELMTAWDMADFGAQDSSLDDLQDQWTDVSLDRDAWLVENSEGQLIGYTAIFKGETRFTIDLYAHPSLADADIRQHLLELCEARAREQQEADVRAPSDLVIFVSRNTPADRQAVEYLSYQPTRYHFRMQIELESLPEKSHLPEGMQLRTFVPGQDDQRVFDLIQAAFERPGRINPSFESWQDFMMGAYNFESDLWFLAIQGEELVAAILCFDYPQYGWVRQLGVDEKWRGRGIGSSLLKHAFGVFYAQGKTTVGLGVDADNPQACRIYEQAGMKKTREFAEYHKSLEKTP